MTSGDTQNNKNATTETREATENDPIEIINTNEMNKTRRLKQAKPPKQAKTPNRWKQAWLKYRMQGHSLPY